MISLYEAKTRVERDTRRWVQLWAKMLGSNNVLRRYQINEQAFCHPLPHTGRICEFKHLPLEPPIKSFLHSYLSKTLERQLFV
jgi:hypothetical protein